MLPETTSLNGYSLTHKIQLIDFTTVRMNLPLKLFQRNTAFTLDKKTSEGVYANGVGRLSNVSTANLQ